MSKIFWADFKFPPINLWNVPIMARSANLEYMQRVRELGCLICGAPASAHHIREERIKNDYMTIPLCPDHHQGAFSIHMAKREFQNVYGSELELLALTIEKLFKNKRL